MKKKFFSFFVIAAFCLQFLCGCWIEDTDERTAQEILYDGIVQLQQEITGLYRFSTDEVYSAYKLVLSAHPELFWVWDSCTVYTRENGVITCFSPEYTMDVAQIPDRQRLFASVAQQIVQQACSYSSEYERALYIHDYLVSSIVYDQQAADEIDNEQHEISLRESSTAYGALVNKRAICSGYTKAFQYLLNLCGMDALFAVGDGITEDGSIPHSWNVVRIDGQYYHIDVTWDDPVYEDDTVDKPCYTYFCLTTQEILKDHTIYAGQELPECTATTYHYFRYNGQYLSAYDFVSVKEIVERAVSLGKSSVDIQFATGAERDRAVASLFENGGIFDIPHISDSKSEYVWYDVVDADILTIYL